MTKTTSGLALAVRFAILLAFFAVKPDATFLAQTARTVVENDQVKVLSVDGLNQENDSQEVRSLSIFHLLNFFTEALIRKRH